MSYIIKHLLDGENLIYLARRHWIVFWFASIWAVLAFIFLFFVPNRLLSFAGYLFAFLFVFEFYKAAIFYYASEFGVTNKRVVMKTGWIQRRSTELLLQKIEAINVVQGFLGRIFDFGTIILVGVGGTRDPFFRVANPLEFRRQIQQELEKVL